MKNNNLINEIWKPIKDFPSYYVSNRGRVYSAKSKKYLSPQVHKQGYLWVNIRNNGKTFHPMIHSLVAKSFIPNPYGFTTVNHKNGIKSDNNVENLEWNTQRQNNIHAYKNGLNPMKISLEEREDIKKLYATKRYSQYRLAKMFEVTQSEINKIINDKFESW